MPSPPPSPPPEKKVARKARSTPLYRRFLEQQREIEQQRHQLAANESEVRHLRKVVRKAKQQRAEDRRSLLAYARSQEAARVNIRNARERLQDQDRGLAACRRNSQEVVEQTHLFRLIDLLRRNGTPRINDLARVEAERLGVSLPPCPPIASEETISYTDGASSSRTSVLPRPPAVPETIRVSGNSSRPSPDQNPSLGSLSTFEDRLTALERAAANAPVYAEVLDFELSPETTFLNISSDFARTISDAAGFAAARTIGLFEEIPITPASALAVALLILFISVLAADRHHG